MIAKNYANAYIIQKKIVNMLSFRINLCVILVFFFVFFNGAFSFIFQTPLRDDYADYVLDEDGTPRKVIEIVPDDKTNTKYQYLPKREFSQTLPYPVDNSL